MADYKYVFNVFTGKFDLVPTVIGVSLSTVKADPDVAAAISQKHNQNTDKNLQYNPLVEDARYTNIPAVNNDSALGASGWQWGSMGFKPTISGFLSQIKIYCYNDSASGIITPYVYSNNAGKPNVQLGSAGTSFDASTVPVPLNWFIINFPTPIAVISGTQYHIVFDCSSMTSGILRWELAETGDYTDGIAYKSSDGINWEYSRGHATDDCLFVIYLLTNAENLIEDGILKENLEVAEGKSIDGFDVSVIGSQSHTPAIAGTNISITGTYTSNLAVGGNGSPFADSYYSTDIPANAFDTDDGSWWIPATPGGGHYIGWDFGEGNEQIIGQFGLATPGSVKNIIIQSSNDFIIWTNLYSELHLAICEDYVPHYKAAFLNSKAYRYYRMYIVDGYHTYTEVAALEFYGIVNNQIINVDADVIGTIAKKHTQDTDSILKKFIYGDTDLLTGGTPTASSYRDPDGLIANACDDNGISYWLSDPNQPLPQYWQYDFGEGNEKVVGKISLKAFEEAGQTELKDFTFAGSNDGATFIPLYTGQKANDTSVQYFTFLNTIAYRYYRITITTSWSSYPYTNIQEIEMFSLTVLDFINNGEILGNTTITGELKIKVYSQTTEPILSGTDFMAIWIDTDDSFRTYLVFRRGNLGTGLDAQVSVELA